MQKSYFRIPLKFLQNENFPHHCIGNLALTALVVLASASDETSGRDDSSNVDTDGQDDPTGEGENRELLTLSSKVSDRITN